MVQVTDKYLQKGIEALRPGGMLHYHQTIPSWMYPRAAIQEVEEAARSMDRKAEIVYCVKVKKYSPGVVHAVSGCPNRQRLLARSAFIDL